MKSFFSIHPYIELFASAVTLSLAIYVFARNPEDRLSKAFSLFSFILAIASFFEFAYRVTPFEEDLLITVLHRLGIVFWSFGFSAFLLFSLVFSEKNKALRNPLTYIVIFMPSIFISYMYLFTDWAVTGYFHMPYGNASRVAPGLYIFILHSSLYSLIALGIMLTYSLRSKNPILIKRGLLITLAILIAAFLGILTNAVLPLIFKIRWFPPQAITGACIICLFTAIAIRRFSLFGVTPDQVIGAFLNSVSDAIIATDLGLKISFASKSAYSLVECPAQESLKDKALANFLDEKDLRLIDLFIKKGDPINNYDTQIKTISGKKLLAKLNGTILKDRLGTKIGALLDFKRRQA